MLMMWEILLGGLVWLLGASLFSFLNVVVYRVPRKISFVRGQSLCPGCGHVLGIPDLIPVFSCLTLGAKCRYCGAKFGWRDTVVELFGGFLALGLVRYHWETPLVGITVFAFFAVLTVVALIDWDTMEIPNGCQVAVVIVALFSFVAMPDVTLLQRGIGAVCVSVPMLLMAMAIPGAFGGGDIKLMAGCGLFLGWKLTLVSTFFGFLLGGIWAIWLLGTKKAGRKEHFAFGPFLCLGMGVGTLFGNQILHWYLSAFL